MPNNTLSSRILIGAIIPLLLLPFLVFLCIMEGTVDLSLQEVWAAITDKSIETTSAFIVQDIRIPQIITAILAGLALSVSGLLMQTLFANPLADPSLLGVNSGAGLGVALVILCFGGSITLGGTELSGFFLIIGASFVGAGAVILLLMLCHAWLPGKLLLLITGVMISFIAGAMISILNFIASAEGIQTFVLWGMGSYSMVNKALLLPFFLIVLIGIVLALLLIKPLYTLLLGDK